MRDTLSNKINDNEVGIVNLDSVKNNGTHWVCYYKNKDKCYYFNWIESFNWVTKIFKFKYWIFHILDLQIMLKYKKML